MNVTGVISRVCLEDASKGIDQGPRTEITLGCVLIGGVSIGTSHAKVGKVSAGGTDKAAVVLVCTKRMFYPGLTNLLKAVVVVRAAAHSVEVVWNDRMIGRRHRDKIHDLVSAVARRRTHAEADLSAIASKLSQASGVPDISGNDIRPRIENFRSFLSRSGLRLGGAVAQEHQQCGREQHCRRDTNRWEPGAAET